MFTLADFEVKMVSWYWDRDCDSLTSVGNVSPKLKEMKTSKYSSVVANGMVYASLVDCRPN